MIAALLAASLASHAAPLPSRRHDVHSAAPCQAVPSLCLTSEENGARPLIDRQAPGADNKMSAFRFDARPCRIIGNLGCPKQARLRLFRLGEPLRETLARTFAPR
ncbi:MAG TPA: hypothetical protein VJM09_00770 [Sphingobium sp.]|nr:hypothetical protein [Sphingobium sp.]